MLLSSATCKEARDGYEQHGPHCRRRKAAQKSKSRDPQPRKNPAADHGAYQAKNHIGDAAKSTAAGNCSR
jgi:hypothetical protein